MSKLFLLPFALFLAGGMLAAPSADAFGPRRRHVHVARPVVVAAPVQVTRVVYRAPTASVRTVVRPVPVAVPVPVPMRGTYGYRPPYRPGGYYERYFPYYGSTMRWDRRGIPTYFGFQ